MAWCQPLGARRCTGIAVSFLLPHGIISSCLLVSGLTWPNWVLSNISSSPSPRGFSSFPLIFACVRSLFCPFNEKREETKPLTLTAPFQIQGTRYLHRSFQFPFFFILSFLFFSFAFASSSQLLCVTTSYLSCKAVTQQCAQSQGRCLALWCG